MALRVKDDIIQLETVIGTNSTQTVADGTGHSRQHAAGGSDCESNCRSQHKGTLGGRR